MLANQMLPNQAGTRKERGLSGADLISAVFGRGGDSELAGYLCFGDRDAAFRAELDPRRRALGVAYDQDYLPDMRCK